MSSKKELGKGLRALLSNIEQTNNKEEKTQIIKDLNSGIATIPVSKIEVNPYQPRVEFNEEELNELASSIKIHGLIQPITVRSVGGDKYQLISGERRMRASKIAGLIEVPAYVRVANDQEMLEMALIENIQRSDLNSIEVAISYQRLIDECSLTHENLSERVGKNRSTVTNYLRLLKLPPEIQSSVKNNDLSMGHARVLAGIDDIAIQLTLYKKATQSQWSVRQLEDEARGVSKKTNPSDKNPDYKLQAVELELERIKKEISAIFGSKIEISRSNTGKGKFVINFKDDTEFNQIYDLLREIEN
ncbi:MAG: hypothetical protein RLZZ546_1354 [Bacteroidota bacterium]|jgi:ParB family chromosome partitioning protein